MSGSSVIEGLLAAKELELASKLQATRQRFAQGGDIGDGAEDALRDFLSEHLPRVFDVGKGEIIDVRGSRSAQTDVVVSTTAQPLRSGGGEVGLYIAEAIHAAGEVKSVLKLAHLEDIERKALRLRSLRKTHPVGAEIFTNPSDRDRWIDGPAPFFVFAFESDIAPGTLLQRLAASTATADAVFVLGKGAAINTGDGQGIFRFRLRDGRDIAGWVWASGRPVLIHLLAWLNMLPEIRYRTSPFMNYLAPDAGDGSLEPLLLSTPLPEAPDAPTS